MASTPSSRLAAVHEPNSLAGPSKVDKVCNKVLEKFINIHYPPESKESRIVREKSLIKVEKIIKNLVKKCTLNTGASEEMAEEAGGNIFISGSYRLGVHTEGTDIDIICVFPEQVTPEDFFGFFMEELKERPDVSHVVGIPEAVVPMLEVIMDGIDIDLLFASLPRSKVNIKEVDVLSDDILRGVSDATAKCLGGPRVTNMLHKLVPNFQEFSTCLRCLRLWAKKRLIYSNKAGYMGGVNYAILAAFVTQLYPNACAATLMENLFTVMLTWIWPTPIMLCKRYEPGLYMEQWDPAINYRNKRDIMPIITPAYPIMNSCYSTNQSSKKVMMEEFRRAKEIFGKSKEAIIMATAKEAKHIDSLVGELDALFEPFDFFPSFGDFLVIEITANDELQLSQWEGYVDSRFRQLVLQFERLRLPFSVVRLHPKRFSGTMEEDSGRAGSCGVIGLRPDEKRLQKGTPVDLRPAIEWFLNDEKMGVLNSKVHREGMSAAVKPVKFDGLPGIFFGETAEEIAENRAAAKARRKTIRKKEKAEKKALQEKIEAERAARIKATTWSRDTDLVDDVPLEDTSESVKDELNEDDVKLEFAVEVPAESPTTEIEEEVAPLIASTETKVATAEKAEQIEADRLVAKEMEQTVSMTSLLSRNKKKRKATTGKGGKAKKRPILSAEMPEF